MYNVLLAVENRKLLRRLYIYLEQESLYAVEIVPYSTDTFDRFVEMRAEIVVIDADNLVPYQTVLKQLQQSQWTYRVVLLRDFSDDTLKDSKVVFVEKTGLSREVFLDTLTLSMQVEEASQAEVSVVLNWNGHLEFTSYPDVYYILLAKYTGDGERRITQNTLLQIRAETAYIGEIEMITGDGMDLLCSMRKARMRTGYEFSSLGKLLLSILGKDYTVIYYQNVKWSALEEAYMDITSLAEHSYFCRGENVSVQQIQKQTKPLNAIPLYSGMTAILDAMLHGVDKEVEMRLKTLYLYDLKPSFDLYARRYVRWMIVMLEGILATVAGEPRTLLVFCYGAVELEYRDVSKRMRYLCGMLSKKGLSENVIRAGIKLFSDYQENLSLESMAEELKINKIYLGRAFREQIGMTMVKYLQRIRLYHAMYFLSERKIKIGQVSKQVGYNDAAYFSKIFKRAIDISPEQYRQKIMKRDSKEDIVESIMEIAGQLPAIL